MAASFDAAASVYHRQAVLQRDVASYLFAGLQHLIEEQDLNPCQGLEIGCGTGFLTEFLLARWPDCQWHITDISPAMVDQCRIHRQPAETTPGQLHFLVADGQSIDAEPGSLDLIVSNLTFQWFTEMTNSTRRLMRFLRPGGWLVFTCLGDQTFRTANQLLGTSLHDYPSESRLQSDLAFPEGRLLLDQQMFVERRENLRELLVHLRQIGAGVSLFGNSLPVSCLRNAILRSARLPNGLPVEYQILRVALQRQFDRRTPKK